MRTFTAVALTLVLAARAATQPPPGETVPSILHPAAAPAPALKYPLLPKLKDQTSPNAALLSSRVFRLGGTQISVRAVFWIASAATLLAIGLMVTLRRREQEEDAPGPGDLPAGQRSPAHDDDGAGAASGGQGEDSSHP
jgi:hypothetical protein